MTFSSTIFSLLPFLLLLLLNPTTAATTTTATATDLITQICKNSSNSDPNINFTFCTTALNSTPRSHLRSANLTKLGLISINLTKRNVTFTTSTITRLLNSTHVDQLTKTGLNDCFELYSDSVSTLGEAARDYRAKRFADANVKLSSVMDGCDTCEEGFGELEVPSPLTKQNHDAFQLSAIALNIMSMVS